MKNAFKRLWCFLSHDPDNRLTHYNTLIGGGDTTECRECGCTRSIRNGSRADRRRRWRK